MKIGQSWLAWVVAIVLGSTGWAQVTRRVSLDPSGAQGNGASGHPSISGDGLALAYFSSASNLLPGDTNGAGDIFRCVWPNNSTRFVSVDSSEVLGNGPCEPPSISADGDSVAFASLADNLVPGDTNGTWDVFVRNRVAGTTQRVSVSSTGAQANGASYYASISADGRYVAFGSDASNLVFGDTNGATDIFVRDLLSAVTARVSIAAASTQGDGRSIEPSISADGRYVAFASFATNFRSFDTNGCVDVFVRDRMNGTTTWASPTSTGGQPNGHCSGPSISADGAFVAFLSGASNLVPNDTNGVWDVFSRHWTGGTVQIVSVSSAGVLANAASSSCSISDEGHFVAFASSATNLVSGDTNGVADVFVRRLFNGPTERVSVASNGGQADGNCEFPAISGNGRFVAFASDATNLVAGDTNGVRDVFLRDLNATGFTSLCHPFNDGVIQCPCSNSGALGRGCNNSAGTTGAFLSATGMAFLSTDSLVFTTFAEKPTALSIVLQGNAFISSGVVYGQGVRCVGGTLKRLYTKTAFQGSITAPEFSLGEPSVSARSAAKGDTILAGQSRWYLVYYRDGQILGGCPATSTFNTTQTGRVDWLP